MNNKIQFTHNEDEVIASRVVISDIDYLHIYEGMGVWRTQGMINVRFSCVNGVI